jgi:hypothetical protein
MISSHCESESNINNSKSPSPGAQEVNSKQQIIKRVVQASFQDLFVNPFTV